MTKIVNNPYRTNAVRWSGETNINWRLKEADRKNMRQEFDEGVSSSVVSYLNRLDVDRRDRHAVIRQNGGEAYFIPLCTETGNWGSDQQRIRDFRKLSPEQMIGISEVMYARTQPKENKGIQSCGLITPGLLENITPNNLLANGAATIDSLVRKVTPFLPVAYGATGLVLVGYGVYAWLNLPNIDPKWGCHPGAHLVHGIYDDLPNHCEREGSGWGSYFATNPDYPIREQAENLAISSVEAGAVILGTGLATIRATFEEAGQSLGNLGGSKQTYFYFEANKAEV
jgi:hypothetical protein